jgi:hypothetical protein
LAALLPVLLLILQHSNSARMWPPNPQAEVRQKHDNFLFPISPKKSIKMNVGQEDSSYLVKLGSLERPLSEVPERFTVPKLWQARWYFFYDTLMQPSELGKILQLPETPILRPAFVKSYTLATYQQSKVLVDEGPISNVVNGDATESFRGQSVVWK